MVLANSHILTGMVFGTALAHDDIAGNYLLTTENFDPEPFAFGLAAILYFTFAFLMCHNILNCKISPHSGKNHPFKGSALPDTFDLNLGKLLAMAILHLVSFSALLLEDNNLIAFNMFQDLS